MDQEIGFERGNILGVGVHLLTLEDTLPVIDHWINEASTRYISTVPAHTVMDALKVPRLRSILNSSHLSTPDGMAVVWFFQIQGWKNIRRVYGPDLCLATCSYGVAKGYRHYFYGSTPEVLEALLDQIQGRFPGIKIAGSYSPPYRELSPEEDSKVLEEINSSNADIVWVGLGSPKQEYWMAEHLGKINTPVMIGVGAAFDFLAGTKPQAPLWIQRSGLEWLFRLATEPRRLWPRYLRYPRFVLLALLQLLSLKEFPIER